MTVIHVVERTSPLCNHCRTPLRRAKSIVEGLCCCQRGTCDVPEPFGCQVCGSLLIGRHDEVLGICSRCSVVVT